MRFAVFDTYIVISAANANFRLAELDNVDWWTQNNNLRLNTAKSAEIMFTNCKPKLCLHRYGTFAA